MPRLVALSEIRDRIRWTTDTESDTLRVTDARLNALINEGIAELHDKLISGWGEAHTFAREPITLAVGTLTYNLPANFYKMAGVQYQDSNIWYRAEPLQAAEMDTYLNGLARLEPLPLRYAITNDLATRAAARIDFIPVIPSRTLAYVNYWLTPPTLTLDTDELDGFAGFEEYVVLWVSIRVLNRDEQDSSQLQVQLAQQDARINAMRPRDATENRTIVDSQGLLSNNSRLWRLDF